VLIGGAAINRRFGRRILQTENERYYAGGVFYCKDAFEGLSTLDQLTNEQQKPDLIAQIRHEADLELGRVVVTKPDQSDGRRSSKIEILDTLPVPPGYGIHVVESMPVPEVQHHLIKNELYRLSWGAKNLHGQEWENLQRDFDERLDRMLRDAQANHWLQPKGIYGYFPAQAEGSDLLVYDPGTLGQATPTVLERFTFPRQKDEDGISLVDYFSPVESGKMDVVVFQVVTVGQSATDRFDDLQSKGDYSEAYYTHGLAVQMAEASADYLHRHIRQELKLRTDQGKRYSWGYPAIPDLADHEKVFRLLPVAQKLGMSLTSAYQLVPEQSTAAIIIHHPQASYFNIGESRIEQLTRG
jgi:5-methyltetrahydrofolate--homocysteine methyltransferase